MDAVNAAPAAAARPSEAARMGGLIEYGGGYGWPSYNRLAPRETHSLDAIDRSLRVRERNREPLLRVHPELEVEMPLVRIAELVRSVDGEIGRSLESLAAGPKPVSTNLANLRDSIESVWDEALRCLADQSHSWARVQTLAALGIPLHLPGRPVFGSQRSADADLAECGSALLAGLHLAWNLVRRRALADAGGADSALLVLLELFPPRDELLEHRRLARSLLLEGQPFEISDERLSPILKLSLARLIVFTQQSSNWRGATPALVMLGWLGVLLLCEDHVHTGVGRPAAGLLDELLLNTVNSIRLLEELSPSVNHMCLSYSAALANELAQNFLASYACLAALKAHAKRAIEVTRQLQPAHAWPR